MIVVDPCSHPYQVLLLRGLVEVIVYGPEQNFSLSWPQHDQQVGDFVGVACEEHVVLMVDEPIAKQKDETRNQIKIVSQKND